MDLINDWFDFVGIFFLSFLIIMLGVWTLPQLPERTHLYVSIAILISSIYFTKKMIEWIVPGAFD